MKGKQGVSKFTWEDCYERCHIRLLEKHGRGAYYSSLWAWSFGLRYVRGFGNSRYGSLWDTFNSENRGTKARRKAGASRARPAGQLRARAMRVSGKSWARNANRFQGKKMPYMPDFGNSRRGHASSTRRTFVLFGISHLALPFLKSRQNSPEGLVYGNSNATTALANSRLVVPALWTLTTHILHRAFVTIFTSNTITKDSEQGFD